MSNSRRARRATARARKPTEQTLRDWPVYSPQATSVLLRESAGAAVLDPPAITPTVEAVSDKPWSDFTQADYTPQQWRRACLIDAGTDDEDSKDRYALPVREPSGTVNRNGVHAAAGRIGQVSASTDAKKAAARRLVGLYRSQLDEDPPERLLTLAGMAESDTGRRSAHIAETVSVAIREAPSGTPLTVDVQLIAAGWNKSGSRYYPADVLARDVPKVYPAGTHMYLDHPTITEEVELPERSVTRLAAVLAEAPYSPDGGATMRAKARIFAPHREFLAEAWRDIGVSINGDGEGQHGTREGRQGLVIEALTYGRSVDFVTKAGAGGRIVSLLESAAHLREARNIGAWLEARLHLALTQMGDAMYGDGRLTREERITLSAGIGDALRAWTTRVEADAPQLFTRDLYDEPGNQPAEVQEATAEETRTALYDAVRAQAAGDAYAYVEDFDPDRSLVWWVLGGNAGSTTWQQTYRVDEESGDAALTGDRVKVVKRVTYEPVATEPSATEESAGQPASQDADGTPPAAPTTEGGESLMPEGTQNTGATPAPAGTEGGLSPVARAEIAEAQLRESQARITALETQNASLTVERDTARTEMARMRVTEAARAATTAALADTDLPEMARMRVTEAVSRDVPTGQDGQLNAAALTGRINEAISAERAYVAGIREAAGDGRPNGLGNAASNGNSGVDLTVVQQALRESYIKRGMSEKQADLAATGRLY